MDLHGARVLITGGARGLGRDFALDLAAAGSSVGVCDVDEAALGEAVKAAAGEGMRLWSTVADVSSESSVEQLLSAFVEDHGGIDVMVNNAGVIRDGFLFRPGKDGSAGEGSAGEGSAGDGSGGEGGQKMPLSDWQAVIDVNLTGVFLCAREAACHMVKGGGGGLIVSMSSISRHGNPGQTNYSAAKAGVAAMTVAWARELSRYGVRAAAIAPGYTGTDMTASLREDVRERIVSRIPSGRMANPAEISHALRFIIENDYINGRVIEVDGGLRA